MAEESITAEALDALAARLDEVEVYLHLDEKRERAAELERQSTQPGFWDDAEHARAIMAELSAARDDVKAVEDARAELADAGAALELAGEMGDDPEAADLVADHGAIEAVVGLPRSLGGGSSSSTRDARRWARRLAPLIAPVPVRLVDERLTTVSAHQALHEAGRRARDFRGVVDQAAAVVILEHALETERRTGAPAGEPVPSTQGDRQ